MKQIYALLTLIFLAWVGAAFTERTAFGQGLSQDKTITAQQLQSLEPDEQNLQGFVRTHPADETSPAGPIPDRIQLNVAPERHIVSVDMSGNLVNMPTPDRNVSTISRGFFSTDGLFNLQVSVTVCASEPFAQDELYHSYEGTQIPWQKLSADDGTQIGDEAWMPVASQFTNLALRYGRLVVFVSGDISFPAKKSGTLALNFPAEAVKAVAYQVLLQASQQPDLTGVSAQAAQVAVNGHALPKNALKVAGRVYVPVQEFAKAMGLTSRWNTKTGALTLSGPKQQTVMLTAGSTAAKVGGAKAASLTVPVLKSSGQPVMTLDDLLRLTGGRITSHVGNTVQVRG